MTTKHETWNDTRGAWRAAFEALVERFRPKYLAEVERFAEALRPRFEAGELRGFTDDDLDRESEDRAWRAPMWQLEDLCAEHFGIEVDEEERVTAGGRPHTVLVERDPTTADMILAVSPSTQAAVEGCIPSVNAKSACAWDVLAVARARGWYTPTADECPRVELTRWAPEVRS